MADFSLVAELKMNIQKFLDGIKKGKESLKSFGGIVEKILGPKGKLVMAIATATTAALKLGQSMNKAMAEVAKGTGATGKELEKFRGTLDQVLEKGVNSSTKEIAKVMADVNTRFKLIGEELANLTVDFDKFATVTEIDVKNSVEKVADVLAKWNIETEDATGLMDQLVVASQDTGVSVETLLDELKQGQAIFSQLGMSATDTIAYLGTLKENGIDSSVALTGLRTALAKWSQEGKNAQQEFKLVAEKIKNAKTETEALNISVDNFGARSGAEMVKVLRNSANGADELKDKLTAAGGAVERTAEATRTSKEAFKVLGDTLKESFGGLFEGLDNLFKGLADTLNNLFNILKPLLMPLFNAVKDILTMVGNVLSNLTSEIQIYVTKYSMGFNAMVAATNSAYQFIHGIMGYLEESFGTVFGFIFSLLEGRFGLAWEYLKKNLLINVKFILDIVSNLVNAVKDQLNTLIEKGINPIIEKINWAQEKLGKKKTEKLSLIENFDLAGITGIDKKIEDVTKKIEELSGKNKKKIVGDLGAVNTKFDDISVSIQGAGKEQKDWNGLIRKQEIEIAGINEDYEKQLELQLEAIENERQSALSSASSAEERAGINKYYDNEIYLARKKIRKKDEKEEKKSWQDRVKDIGKTLAGFAKTVATVFKNVGKVISKVFNKTWEIVKGAVSKIASGFKSLVGLSVSDTLDALLKFEDGILTFFVETLPQLPGFIKSVLDSVGALFSGLKDSIDVTQLSDIIENMVDYVASNLPDLVDDFFSVLSRIMGGALNGLNKWLESGGSDKLSKGVSKMLTSLSKNTRKFVEDGLPVVIKVIQDIADGVIDWLDNGGIEDILAIILNIQKQLETFVTDNLDKIADLIADHVEDFGNFIADSMESANKTLPKLISAVLKVIVAIIDAIAKAFEDESFVKSIVESIEDVIKEIIKILPDLLSSIVNLIVNIITALVPELPGLIIRVVNEIAKAIPNIASQLASSLFDGILKIFKQIFTGDFWSQAFSDIGEGFSGAFSDGDGYGKNSTGSTAGDLAVDLLVPGGFLRHFFATGTNSASRGLALVGEAGPELVNFRGGEQVLNARNTQKALDGMGGSTNNFNVVFNNTQDTTAFAMMQQLKAYNRRLAINGVL